jgi:predicted ATPase with chaperone activity
MPERSESEEAVSLKGNVPSSPGSVAATQLNYNALFKLLLKVMYLRGVETHQEIADAIKLPMSVVQELLDDGRERKLIEILGTVDRQSYSRYRFSLTGQGESWAAEALAQNQYAGPAPVTLEEYRAQIGRQPLSSERIDREQLVARFEGLLVPPTLERRIGPALNSARSILFYGPPGNGKTTIAEAIAAAFGGDIYIPYAIEVEGELIRIFDPTLHKPVDPAALRPRRTEGEAPGEQGLYRSENDQRWVLCRRPVIGVAGELTLEMLSLGYSPVSRFYEAPMHMKAIGGVFIVDDLGRQLVRPEDLLNRWNVPLERRVDYLTLQSGASFWVPFDALVIFSTNLDPAKLMNAAFLRRIPYKIEMGEPSVGEFTALFIELCRDYDLRPDPELIAFAVREIQAKHKQPLAFYQPKFIVEQVIAASRYEGQEPSLSKDRVNEAMENISVMSASSAVRDPASSAE